MSSDTHCATCHELVFLKLYLIFFSNTTRFYFNLEIILNRFGNVAGMPQVPALKNLTIVATVISTVMSVYCCLQSCSLLC